TVIDVVDRIPVGPASGEPVPLHRRAHIADVVVAFHHDAVGARVIGVGSAVLDVPGFEAELLEREEIVHRLPGDAGERHLPDEMKNDDLAASGHEDILSGSPPTTAAPALNFRACKSRNPAQTHSLYGVVPARPAC